MQKLEQIQEERTLSFEEICPTFSQLIAEHGWEGVRNLRFESEDGKVRDIYEGAHCVVGEAHDN